MGLLVVLAVDAVFFRRRRLHEARLRGLVLDGAGVSRPLAADPETAVAEAEALLTLAADLEAQPTSR